MSTALSRPQFHLLLFCCWVTESCPTLCDPMDCSTPGFPVFTISQSLLKLMSTEFSDAIQPMLGSPYLDMLTILEKPCESSNSRKSSLTRENDTVVVWNFILERSGQELFNTRVPVKKSSLSYSSDVWSWRWNVRMFLLVKHICWPGEWIGGAA